MDKMIDVNNAIAVLSSKLAKGVTIIRGAKGRFVSLRKSLALLNNGYYYEFTLLFPVNHWGF
jgi:hypothetical protein